MRALHARIFELTVAFRWPLAAHQEAGTQQAPDYLMLISMLYSYIIILH